MHRHVDPRGVGWTTPVADCYSFPSPNSRDIDENDVAQGQFNRLEFALSNEAVGLVNSSDVALTKLDGATRAVAQLCEVGSCPRLEFSLSGPLSKFQVYVDSRALGDRLAMLKLLADNPTLLSRPKTI